MDIEKVCGLCGRSYKLEPQTLQFACDCHTIYDKSHMHLNFTKRNKPVIYDYDICPHCVIKLHKVIIDIQRNRPKKCEFCEFDRSSRMPKLTECEECRNFNNFQLKKRMHPRQLYEWEKYKRYLCEGE